ncbi:hypothetical protein BYT27DRAFT_7226079 [Phlegmacium glaucopus]|nr:hypothetical protein BYT27DRAFT_7226079 [Phlegmacium glaucopus]
MTKLPTGAVCNRGFCNRSGLTQHIHAQHQKFAPKEPSTPPNSPASFDDPDLNDFNELHEEGPEQAQNMVVKHPILDGTPCNKEGHPRTPQDTSGHPRAAQSFFLMYSPYNDRADFELANFLFAKNQMPGSQIDELLDIWAAKSDVPLFADHKDLYRTIDSTIVEGEVPPWMLAEYEVWHPYSRRNNRDPHIVLHQQLENPDFDGKIHYTPSQETDVNGERHWQDLMSANWAWKQADIIAEDPDTHGAMFVPVVLGSDKTTVSIATGQTEYYPLYASLGNVSNSIRHAHKNAVTIIGFLAIPKMDQEYADNNHFQKFRRQLFHSSLAAILEPLKPGMSKPEVVLCPDGHYRRAIYAIGPYIADYPEQVLLACVVQDWCPRCTTLPQDLDRKAGLRLNVHRDTLIYVLSLKMIWSDYGYVGDVTPFTAEFPRADIHELLTSDLLHQIIKGTFKDHLITWVGEYLTLVHGKSGAAVIMADIDCRIAAVPPFPGLRCFPEGRGFKQWTGDNSKALMKVYLPAIAGHVPPKMVQALMAFLDFCYLICQSVHMEATLREIDEALARFHEHCQIFEEEGVCPEGLSLPRQHSLVHYKAVIQLFGSPNGLCSSITKSKHIKAIKEPWCHSSHYKALGQMLLTNQRLDKLAASRIDFITHSMLSGPLPALGVVLEAIEDEDGDKDDTVAGPQVMAELHPNTPIPGSEQPQNLLPVFNRHIKVFHSAVAEFFAPSDPAGIGGMHREWIQATPSWRGEGPHHDCLFATKDPNLKGMLGLHVAQAILFFSFKFNRVLHPCVLVQWFSLVGDEPCNETAMWMVECDWEEDGTQSMGVIHIDTVVRGAHLIPVYGEDFVPRHITCTNSLDYYSAYYVSKFADHHSYKIAF